MKKTSLVLGIVLILVGLIFTKVSALDMNLVNSIRQNEQNAAENLYSGENASSTSNQILSNFFTNNDLVENDVINENATYNPSSNISNVSPNQSTGLGVNGVINIILIVVGVLIILLGIAILIRSK